MVTRRRKQIKGCTKNLGPSIGGRCWHGLFLSTVFKIITLCSFNCVADDDGGSKQNGSGNDAGGPYGYERTFESDDKCGDKTHHGDGPQKIAKSIGRIVDARDCLPT